jgi:CheY-like chemotaxis protein
VRSLERAGLSPERSGAVLVVDDDAASLKLMMATLGQLGYQATCVERAAEALTIAAASPPLLVIVDLLMPEMDGFEFLDRFRRLPQCRQTPVLVWTVKDLSAEECSRLRLSAQGFVQKGREVGSGLVDELRGFLPPLRGVIPLRR